ncbi:MAG: bifunctional diguanylate cyclase/phosphodiesterase [Roseibium sp.]|nr:bifunctional diguanylate cyclase/phosphodiesterase [Roseibium sp.]
MTQVQTIDRGLHGLAAIEQLTPLLEDKLQNTFDSTTAPHPDLSRLGLTISEQNLALSHYERFIHAKLVGRSLSHARDYVRVVAHAANLGSISDQQSSEFKFLISDTIPAVIFEAAALVHMGDQLASKETINQWVRMVIPVQGGQFKVAADNVGRITPMQSMRLPAERSEELKRLASAFRDANASFQSAGSELLLSTGRASVGSDIVIEPALARFPALAKASMDLWNASIAYMIDDLQGRRNATLLRLVLASSVGLLVILAAFGLAIVLGRSLAEQTQQEFDALGFHDPLTGLPNRRALMRHLENPPADKAWQTSGMVLIDIRHFKAINSVFGEGTGDSVLREVAQDLSSLVSGTDFIARTGGTEFIIVRHGLSKSLRELRDLADTAADVLTRERHNDGRTLALDTCIGLSLRHGAVAEETVLEAALALKAAKRKGSSAICVFDPDMRAEFDKNAEVAKELALALKNGRIVSWFQPQICARTGATVGAEALVRWIDDDNGIRFPAAFLPAAAEAGYMDAVDDTVRGQAFELAAEFVDDRPMPFHVGINVSASFLAAPDCVERLLDAVHEAGLSPRNVSVEILEAVMVDAVTSEPVKANVATLSQIGFFVELDDFGTGHSSISSLRDLHVDRVKIDRSFVSGVDSDPDLQKFTSALIQLAKSLDIEVLAEGVETQAELDWLAASGCDVIQGWLVSKAVPREEFLAKAATFGAAISLEPAGERSAQVDQLRVNANG